MADSLSIREIMKRRDTLDMVTRSGTPEKLGRIVESESVRLGTFISARIEPI